MQHFCKCYFFILHGVINIIIINIEKLVAGDNNPSLYTSASLLFSAPIVIANLFEPATHSAPVGRVFSQSGLTMRPKMADAMLD